MFSVESKREKTFISGGEILRTFQHVVWAGSGLVIVCTNNIFYKPELSSPVVHQLTNTGSDQVAHGVTEGMYRGRLELG